MACLDCYVSVCMPFMVALIEVGIAFLYYPTWGHVKRSQTFILIYLSPLISSISV